MVLHSKRLGDIEYTEMQRFTMIGGLHGFSHLTEWVMLELPMENSVALVMHSLTEDVIIPVCPPCAFDPHYYASNNLVEGTVFVTVRKENGVIVGNLLGPICFNGNERTAQQLVLHDTFYHTAHPMLTNA